MNTRCHRSVCSAVFTVACVFWCLTSLSFDAKAVDYDGDDEYLMELAETPLDLNVADIEEIALLPGVCLSSAAAVVELRNTLGGFQSLSDLVGAGVLAEPALARIRPYVTLGSRKPGRKRLHLRAEGGIWRSAEKTHDDAVGLGGAGDVYLRRGDTRIRVRYRSKNVQGVGGVRMSLGQAVITAGDIRAPGLPTLAVELGHNTFSRDGPFPGASSSSALTTRGSAARVTTGTGERLRGVVLKTPGCVQGTFLAGAVIGPWGKKSDLVGLLSARLFSRPGFEIWSGGIGTGRRAGEHDNTTVGEGLRAAVITSVLWRRDSAHCSANLATGASGGAWLVSIAARPENWNRVGLALAGRWGGYINPLGLHRFRSPTAPTLLTRWVAGVRPRWVGSVSAEQLLESGAGRVTSSKRVLTWRRRLHRGAWLEGEFRDELRGGARVLDDFRMKLIWRPSRQGWAEVLYKAIGREGTVSTLAGWRAGAGGVPLKVEIGGFSFCGDRALYFYEREIVGRSSIKALKGEGIGCYLYLCLEPDSDTGLGSVFGPVEIKLRQILRWDTPISGTFVGVQIGRRWG